MSESKNAGLTESQRVLGAAVKYGYWNNTTLIEASRRAGLLMNLNKSIPYSYARIYAMLKEGQTRIADKLIDFAEKNPRI